MLKMGTKLAMQAGTWVSFTTPYYSDTNYKFFPFGYDSTNIYLVNIGDALSSTKTISGIWVFPAADNVTVDYITLGS